MEKIFNINGGISLFVMYISTCILPLMLRSPLPILMMVACVSCMALSEWRVVLVANYQSR